MPSQAEIQALLTRLQAEPRYNTLHIHPDDMRELRRELGGRHGMPEVNNLLNGIRVNETTTLPRGTIHMTAEPEYLGRMMVPAPFIPDSVASDFQWALRSFNVSPPPLVPPPAKPPAPSLGESRWAQLDDEES